jgi:hypothetical protein
MGSRIETSEINIVALVHVGLNSSPTFWTKLVYGFGIVSEEYLFLIHSNHSNLLSKIGASGPDTVSSR